MFAAEDSMYSHTISLQWNREKKNGPEVIYEEMLEMQMAWEVINSVLTLGHESRKRTGFRRSCCRHNKHRYSACCFIVCIHLFSMSGCNTTTAGKFIAVLTMHSSLILHTSLQGKLVFWGLFSLCIGGEISREDCLCDAVSIDLETGCLLIQNVCHQHCIM